LIRAIERMENALEDSLPMSDFAAAAGVSPRELERQFRKWLKTTPAAYYRGLRLDRSRQLLRQTDLPIIEIAFRSGFGSAAHFSRSFSSRFGHPPSAERRPLTPKF
jgi:AraC family carnitine catabolism transcriptional activator